MEKKIVVAKNERYRIETLLEENLTLTGKEILELQQYNEDCYKLWVIESQKKEQQRLDWLLEHRYFKIKYNEGSNLTSYLEILGGRLSHGTVYFDCYESHTSNMSIVRPTGFMIETLMHRTDCRYDNHFYGIDDNVTILTKEEYDAFHTAVENFCK